jgi:SAM-dependent methyltransferase
MVFTSCAARKAKRISKFIRGRKIYDIGCDEGTLQSKMEEFSQKNIVGIDMFKGAHTDIVADANKDIPIANNSADTIIASEIIEHLDCPLNFLNKCWDKLNNNGILILTTPNALGLSEIQGLIAGKGKQQYIGHIYNWNRGNFQELLRKTKFKTIHFEYLKPYWRLNILFRFITWLVPVWRPTLFFVLKKEI